MEELLCQLGGLEPGSFPLTARQICRGGDVQGYHFCLHGPRSVRLTAVADFTADQLIAYGIDGRRRPPVPLPGDG